MDVRSILQTDESPGQFEYCGSPEQHLIYHSLAPTLIMPKKRRISGLSGSELLVARQALESLRNTILFEETETTTDDGKKDSAEVVDDLIKMMKERAEGSQV